MIKEFVSFQSLGEKISGTIFFPETTGTDLSKAGSDKKFPALIICHGASDFKENFYELAEHLVTSNNVAVLCIDMHGHGESEGERYNVKMNEWTADIVSAIDFLTTDTRIDADNIHLFGFSSGGTAVLETAIQQSKLSNALKSENTLKSAQVKIKSIILLDATVRDLLPFFERLILKTLVQISRIKKTLTGKDIRLHLAKFSKSTHLANNETINDKIEAEPRVKKALDSFPLPGATEAFFVDTLKDAHLNQIPTLILWGEKDEVDSPKTATLLYDALKCTKEIHIIPENGHVGHLDTNKEKVFALMSDWMKRA